MNYKNIIAIHLTKYQSLEEFKALVEYNDLDIEPEYLMKYKGEGYTKIFIDKETLSPIAYCHNSAKKQIFYQEDFTLFLKNMPSISYKRNNNNSLDIDTILEKIHQKGIDSLTKSEKNFLDNLNK